VKYFFIGNQKVVLFPTFRENDWEAIASVLRIHQKKKKIVLFIFVLDDFLGGFYMDFLLLFFFFFFETGVSMR
jgi:hypothetical protein